MPGEKWCSLPRDVLEHVAGRLNSFADRVRLRAVCRWWRFAVSANVGSGPNFPPYLFFNKGFFCLVEKRNYRLPVMQRKCGGYRTVGCYNGWLVRVDLEADFYLLNPFSGDRIDVLPPLWTIPDVQPVRYDYVQETMVYRLKSETSRHPKPVLVNAEHLCTLLINKFALSPNMTSVVVYRNKKKLAFAGPDSEYWTDVDVPTAFSRGGFRDVVYHHDDRAFYAIDSCGAAISVDAADGNVETVVESYVRPRNLYAGPYLASLPTGELLCLYVVFAQPAAGNLEASRFEVLKLVREKGRPATWVTAESLHGWALFWDSVGVRAQPSAEAVGYKGNCIYFALSHKLVFNGKKLCSTDSGIFDVAERRIHPISGTQHQGNTALWIQPSSSC